DSVRRCRCKDPRKHGTHGTRGAPYKRVGEGRLMFVPIPPRSDQPPAKPRVDEAEPVAAVPTCPVDNTRHWVRPLLLAAVIGLGIGALAGIGATEWFIEQERRQIESDPRYMYNNPRRTPFDTGLGGCLGGLAGTLVGALLLWFTKGRMWVL